MKFYIMDMFVLETVMYLVHEKNIFIMDKHNNLFTAWIDQHNLKCHKCNI